MDAIVVVSCMLLQGGTLPNVALPPSRPPRSGTMTLCCNPGGTDGTHTPP
jgi:hypothetical protein